MIFLSGLALLLVVGVWLARRRCRAARLAGITATKPVFSVEPPRRHLSNLKGQRL